MQSRRPDVLKYLENYREVARRVKEIVLRHDPSAEAYVFGSVLSGRYTASSDIDVLVVSDRADLEYVVKVAVYRELGEAPVELHYTDRERFERWYKRFIDELERV